MFDRIVLLLFISLWGIGMCQAKTEKLKIVTFNVGGDFISEGPNQWKNRWPLVKQFLSKEYPDILCMQEVLINQLNEIKTCFKMYNMVGVSRVDGKTKGDFVPVFYRRDKFEHITSGTFCLSQKPDSIGFIGWDAKYPRIATWVNLRNIKTEDVVFVVNVHLDNVGKVARENSMKLILDKIRSLSKSQKIILTGDFNDIVSSNVHKVASQGGLIDTYLVSPKKKGVRYTFHQFGEKELEKRYKLDYIFTSGNIKILSTNIPKETPQSGVFISDHNPIVVKMKF